MGAWQHLTKLIDEVDEALANSHSANKIGERLIVSTAPRSVPRVASLSQKKILLLQQMSEAFIEPQSKSVRLSALLTFCYESGLELVTHNVVPYTNASFIVRTPGFDIVVTNESK